MKIGRSTWVAVRVAPASASMKGPIMKIGRCGVGVPGCVRLFQASMKGPIMKIGRLDELRRKAERLSVRLNEGADHEDRPGAVVNIVLGVVGESLNEGADHEDRPGSRQCPQRGCVSLNEGADHEDRPGTPECTEAAMTSVASMKGPIMKIGRRDGLRAAEDRAAGASMKGPIMKIGREAVLDSVTLVTVPQ